MKRTRKVQSVVSSRPTVEGAGVHLRRAFGFDEAPDLDPFLLLDDFRSANPREYLPGFPWHPHRGIETITYMIDGSVAHGDSMENHGTIHKGDVQWMTAGSGIIHQEMPEGDKDGRMGGFQLWANLPASEKMKPPVYRDVRAADIPAVEMESGAVVKIIAGTVNGVTGPVSGISIAPEYLDVTVSPDSFFHREFRPDHTVFAYVFEGRARFEQTDRRFIDSERLVRFTEGEQMTVTTGKYPVRFLLVSGKPLEEPVAWRGPIVMNTRRELEFAFEEYRNGTFIKHGAP